MNPCTMRDKSIKNTPSGRLFVFEGPDGVGKTTVAKKVCEELQSAGYRCKLVAFPGNRPTSLGKLVYDLHHNPASLGIQKVSATGLQLLHIAAHIDAIEQEILPALSNGTTVLLDRFWWSAVVYGRATEADEAVLRHAIYAELHAWRAHVPSCAFLFRRRTTGSAQKIMDYYEEVAAHERSNHPIIAVDNDLDVESAVANVLRTVQQHLSNPVGEDARSDVVHEDTFVPHDATGNSSAEAGHEAAQRTIDIYARLAPAKPTAAFEYYWRFACERQNIFFRRVRGEPSPWTEDSVLCAYRFTNAYRASDRVSQYLIRNVIYGGDQHPNELFFRTILFKIFNKIATWELLQSRFGHISLRNFSVEKYGAVLDEAFAKGQVLYSAAYIMPSCKTAFHAQRKHANHLQLIDAMIRGNAPKKIAHAKTMSQAFDILKSFPGLGNFLAYQYCIDLNYSTLTDFSEMQFVVPGPGALDGIHKCFSDLGGLTEVEMIKYVTDNQEREFESLGLTFKSLWGRRLQLIDCQNLFCELSKYARVVYPELAGLSGRTTIKQRFRPQGEPIRIWYPPKWGLNDHIEGGGIPE